MAEKTIEQRVKDIIVEQLGVNADQVTPDAKFIEDLGADSLDTVELVMALEEEFGSRKRASAITPPSSRRLSSRVSPHMGLSSRATALAAGNSPPLRGCSK